MITGSAAIAKRVGERVAGARAEQELGALRGIAEQVADAGGQRLDAGAAPAGVEHEPGDRRLQREGGADDAQADRPAVGREQQGDAEDDDDPGDAEQLLIHRDQPLPKGQQTCSTRPCPA